MRLITGMQVGSISAIKHENLLFSDEFVPFLCSDECCGFQCLCHTSKLICMDLFLCKKSVSDYNFLFFNDN